MRLFKRRNNCGPIQLCTVSEERDEWKLRAERAERELASVSAQLARTDEKWRHAYNRLREFENRNGVGLKP